MRIEFTLTPEDVADIGTLVVRDQNARSQRLKQTLWWVFILGLAAVFFFITRRNEPPRPPPQFPVDPQERLRGLFVFWISLAIAVFTLVWLLVIAPRRRLGKILWDNLPGLRIPHIVELKEDEIVQSSPEAKTTWKWDLFTFFDETSRLIALRLGTAHSILIPKSALSASELEALRMLLRQRLETVRTQKDDVGLKSG